MRVRWECRPAARGRHSLSSTGGCFPAGLITGLLTLALVSPVGADWPMFGAGPLHLGVAEAGPLPPLAVRWSVALGSSVDCSAAVVGNQVFVGTADGEMCALSTEQGAVLWRFRTEGAIVSSPAVVSGRVVFGSVDRFIYCLSAADGRLLWKYRTWRPVIAPPTVAGDVAYVGSMDGTMTALELASGQVRWQVEDPAGISSAPVVTPDLLYYGDRAGTVHVRRTASGEQVWSAAAKSPVMAGPSLASDTLLVPYVSYTALVPPKVDYLIAFDAATGARRWALNGAVSVFTTPAVADGVVYFAQVEGYLSATEARAVSLADGALVWKRALPPIVTSSPALAGDYLYLGAGDGALYCLARATGEIKARVPLAKKIYASPALSDGRLYLGGNDGRLYCVATQ